MEIRLTQSYIVPALAAAPGILERLVSQVEGETWDRRPDPERFSLREMVAHLADWETIWLERVELLIAQSDPALPGYDPDERASSGDYRSLDPHTTLRAFADRRATLVARMEPLSPSEWQRAGRHSEFGPMTLQELATLIFAHDAYHLEQALVWTGPS